MSDESIEQVLERLDRLGELSGEGFEVLVRQAVIEGVSFGIWATVWACLAVAFAVVAKRTEAGTLLPGVFGHGDKYQDISVPWAIAFGVISVGFTLVAAAVAMAAARRLIHPEFYAIRYVLQQIG